MDQRARKSKADLPAVPLWRSPETDPTNPFRQEATGELVPNERASERRVDEVGLTDEDRAQRSP
jgi:hypothetical protein